MRFGATASPANKMSRHTTIPFALFLCALIATSSAFSQHTAFPAHVVPHSSSAAILGASSSTVAESAETAINEANTAGNDDSNNTPLQLLEDALRPSNSDASQKILNNLAAMRQNNQQMEAETYLDGLLKVIDANTQEAPAWTRLPAMTRFSRRARLASLARTLELSTPPADDEEDDSGEANDAEVSEGRRRRRALAVLIRTLSRENEEQANASASKRFARPTIRSIERAAVRGAKESATLEDMENRIPEGLETPKYDVVVRNKRSGYEIRQYQPYSLATVGMSSKIKANDESRSKTDRRVSQPTLSGASSFGALAGYLFGKNSKQMSMAMTSPVFTTNAAGENNKDGREMSFVMPSDYWAEDGVTTAPQPLDGSGVTLQRNEGGTRAVVMFGGFASKSDIAKRKDQLLNGLEADKDYVVKEGSTVTLAQYNDPFTFGWKRRNEVSIDVVPASSSSPTIE